MIGYDGDVDDRAGTGLGTGLGVGVGSPVGPRSGGGGHKYQGLLSELVNNLRPPSLHHSSPPKIVVYVYLSHSFPLCDSYIYPVHTPLSPSPSLSPSFHLTPLYALYTYHSPPPPPLFSSLFCYRWVVPLPCCYVAMATSTRATPRPHKVQG